jgi:ubiquinone biosynthesis monooxygenase Coq7
MELAARLKDGETLGDRVMKVNHAGEHGAISIYRGQLLVCRVTAPQLMSELRDFLDHEYRHREIFARELQRRAKHRCRSYHLCGVGGFILGIATGLCGPSAVASTTAAVENVVLQHLSAQLRQLRDVDSKAYQAISSIVDDEQSHHDRSALRYRQGSFWPRVISPVVATATEAVIWLGMRL